MGICQSIDDDDDIIASDIGKLKIYQQLLNMNFAHENAYNASIKYPNDLKKAIKHANNNKTNDNVINYYQENIIITNRRNLKNSNKYIKCWGVLRDPNIYFYRNKRDINNIVYDITNLLNIYKIEKCPILHLTAAIQFGIKLYDHKNSHKSLLYGFQSEQNRDGWYDALSNALNKNKHINNNEHNDNIIYSECCLINKNNLFCMQLRQKDNNLYLYDNGYNDESKKYKMSINLNNYKKVECTHFNEAQINKCYAITRITTYFSSENGSSVTKLTHDISEENVLSLYKLGFDRNDCIAVLQKTYNDLFAALQILLQLQTLFKYGIILKQEDNSGNKYGDNDILLLFKSNNKRHSFHTHIDYIIHSNERYDHVANEWKDNDNTNLESKEVEQKIDDDEQNGDHKFDECMKLLSDSMSLYNIWMNNNDRNRKSLKYILKTQLNVDEVDILNNFHHIMNNRNKLNTNKKCRKQQCSHCLRHNQYGNNNEHSNNYDDPLCELFDKIHVFTSHSSHELIRNNITDKFVISMKASNAINNIDDEKTNNEYIDDATSISFAFGEYFLFYDAYKGARNYISTVYPSFVTELTLNPYYKLPREKYNKHYKKALQLIKTDTFKTMQSHDAGKLGEEAGMYKYDKITINHLIALLLYCNETELQKIFKKHIRKINKDESRMNIYKRASYIGHWLRLLQESNLFGKQLHKNDVVYCGMDAKLLFDQFDILNQSPLSTTTSLVVANNFAMNDGIILKLKSNSYLTNCIYFDMTLISDFDEKERFFTYSRFKITDIIIEAKSNKNIVSSLRLLQNILNGSLFYYDFNDELISKNTQNTLIDLLNDFMNNKKNTNYFNKMADHLIKSFIDRTNDIDPSGMKAIFINNDQLNKLSKDLSQYFSSSKSKLFLFVNNNLNKYPKINYVKNICKIKLDQHKINDLKTKYETVFPDIFIDDYKFQILFHKETLDHEFNYRFVIGICLKSKINSTTNTVKILWDLVCPQIEYRQIQTYALLSENTDYSYWYAVFCSSSINKLNYIELDLNIRVLI